MLILFWTCLATIAFVYFGYPLLLGSGLLGGRQAIRRAEIQPLVTFIVAAHNEESVIEDKLKNLLASEYPSDRIEILVGSDGSSDRTERLVEKYARDGVGLISFPQQQGKSAMQNRLVAAASGSILVFTDADTLIAADALRRLVAHFADPTVGLVTSHPRYLNECETSIARNEGVYFRYEGWLRKRESACGLLGMAAGPLFAIRRSLWQPIDPNLGDDFVLPLRVVESGMRNLLEPDARVSMPLAQTSADSMLRMKVRIVSKDLRALLTHRELLNPMRYGRIALGLWSHKLLRWFVPYFLAGLFVSDLFLIDRPLFEIALALQVTFYIVALAGFALRRRAVPFPCSIPFSFCLVNLAAFLGTLKCLSGKTSGQWEPVRKQSPTS